MAWPYAHQQAGLCATRGRKSGRAARRRAHYQDEPMGITRGYSLNELQSEEKGRQRRKLAEHAINLAMSGSWDEAVEVNRRLVEEFDPDVEAWNRLGKAYAQLGRIADARVAYDSALALDPSNTIAQRNRQRLAALREEAQVVGSEEGRQADPAFFIE